MPDKPRKRQYKNLGPLGDLLLRACKPNEAGVQSIPILAGQLGISPESLYKRIHKVQLSGSRAVQIVENSEGRVSLKEFDPYVYKP